MSSLLLLAIVIGAVILLAALAWVVVARRNQRPTVIDPDEDLKQTCELNYTPE